MSFNYTENDRNQGNTSFTTEDIQNNRLMAALCYLGPFWLIPFFVAREDSPYVRFHLNQGLILLVLSILIGGVARMFSWIPLVRIITGFVFGIIGIVFLVLHIYGIYNAITGKAKELPFIGGFQVIS